MLVPLGPIASFLPYDTWINTKKVISVEPYCMLEGHKTSKIWMSFEKGVYYIVRGTPTEVLAYLKGGFMSVEAKLSASDLDTLKAAGFTPADVINWIAAHSGEGVALLKLLLPKLITDPQLLAVFMLILDLIHPPTPTPAS